MKQITLDALRLLASRVTFEDGVPSAADSRAALQIVRRETVENGVDQVVSIAVMDLSENVEVLSCGSIMLEVERRGELLSCGVHRRAVLALEDRRVELMQNDA